MPALCTRRISQVGGSKVVPLPLDWLRALGLDSGNTIEVFYDSILILAPSSIPLDLNHVLYELQLLERFRKTSGKPSPEGVEPALMESIG